jgi:hypothetical protein
VEEVVSGHDAERLLQVRAAVLWQGEHHNPVAWGCGCPFTFTGCSFAVAAQLAKSRRPACHSSRSDGCYVGFGSQMQAISGAVRGARAQEHGRAGQFEVPSVTEQQTGFDDGVSTRWPVAGKCALW